MAEEKPSPPERGRRGQLRRRVLFVLFATVLLIPKTLALRRRPRLWNGLRLAAGGAGLAGLAGAITGRVGWASGLAALLLLGFALLLPAQKKGKSIDEVAREMGALVVVNGGRYQGRAVRLYVAPEQMQVLSLGHEPILTIPLAATMRVEAEQTKEALLPHPEASGADQGLRFASTEEAGEGWQLRIEWGGGSAVFRYEGFFAEHLARVAETTLRSQFRRELPVIG